MIATLGTEPQVVTAALDLLQRQGERVSRAVVVHTTAPGSLIEAAVERLRGEFSHSHPGFGLPPLKNESSGLLNLIMQDTPWRLR